MIETLPNTNEDCMRVLSKLYIDRAKEYDKNGESHAWKEFTWKIELVKDRRQELLVLQ